MNRFCLIAALVCSLLLTSACSGSAYKLPNVSPEEKKAAEEKIASDISKLKVYKRSDSAYKTRIANISKRLHKGAGPLCEQAEYDPCYFEVIYSDENVVNAYAHEDYKITVFKVLLQYLKNDDEMAALVAHEMGHHLAKHNQETLRNAQTGAVVSGVFTALLLGAANANNPYYYNSYQQQQDQKTINDMMQVGFEIGKVSYSKEQEREADLLAAYLLGHSGYNLDKAQGMMYTLARLNGDEIKVEGKAALLKTHPPTSERYIAWAKAKEEIQHSASKLPVLVGGEAQ